MKAYVGVVIFLGSVTLLLFLSDPFSLEYELPNLSWVGLAPTNPSRLGLAPANSSTSWTHHRQTTNNLQEPLSSLMLKFHRVNASCPRFARITFTGNGAGHTLTEYLFSVALALDLGATLVYDQSFHLNNPAGGHGSTAWLHTLLAFDHGDYTLQEAISTYNPRILPDMTLEKSRTMSQECNVLFQNGYGTCFGDCFFFWHKTYEDVKWLMRYKFLTFSTYEPSRILFDITKYNVAWHLRVGDITVHADKRHLFQQVYDHLTNDVLPGLDVHHYVFFDARAQVNGPPQAFQFLADIIKSDVTWVGDTDPALTVYHFINADLLVGSGSSFSAIANLVAVKPVILQFPWKENREIHCYDIAEVVRVEASGKILLPFDQLRAQVFAKYRLYHRMLFP